MKKFLIRIETTMLLIIFLFTIIKINYVYAIDEVASGSCGNDINWSLDSNGVLTITGNGKMSGNKCAWAEHKEKVKKVIFNGNITSISACAFEYNLNLESIELPDTLIDMGRRAFAECTNLKTVIFPEGLKEIGVSAFYKCINLESVELGKELMYIRSSAFAECTGLKSIKIKSELVLVTDEVYTIYENTHIYGHKYTGLYYYARQNGRTFTDLDTNKTYTGKVTNQDYLNALPKENIEALGVISNKSTSENPDMDDISFCNKKDETNTNYQAIKTKVEELTNNCTIQKEKAREIANWVYRNIDYQYFYGAHADIDRIYDIFNKKIGSCEAYTMLTNYMLYLCDIPTATARNLTHEWTVAYVDGEWIYIDTTHGIFGATDVKTNEIVFTHNGTAYIINDPTEEKKFIGTIPSKNILKGDINGDGVVNMLDINYGYIKLQNGDITQEEKQRGDVTGEGVYNLLDINKMYLYLEGKISNFD